MTPLALSRRISSQKSRRALGSTPAVGSSSSSNCGSCSRHAASASRCFQPPDSEPASCFCAVGEAEVGQRLVDPLLAPVEPVHARDEIEVLADRQVLVVARTSASCSRPVP